MYIAKIEEIRRHREEKNYTKTQLAILSSLPKNAIGRIENGEVKKTQFLRAMAIAKALKCKVTDIFEDERMINL